MVVSGGGGDTGGGVGDGDSCFGLVVDGKVVVVTVVVGVPYMKEASGGDGF